MANRRQTPAGLSKIPKFVKFHRHDLAIGCDAIFWEDPMTYEPRRSADGRTLHWGLFPYNRDGCENIDAKRIERRMMRIRTTYGGGRSNPEQQFVNALIAKKVQALQTVDIEEYKDRDYILYIHSIDMPKLPDSQSDRLWRRVRVSGGLTLSVFMDKVFTPLFGLIRNFHAHVIHDLTDGALFGPKDCDAVDMMHLPQTGYGYIPDDEYKLAHIIQEMGQTMCIQYDYGDNWYFDVTIEEVFPTQASTGAVVVLGGSGTHPPAEVTPGRWAELLSAADQNVIEREAALEEMFSAMNYRSRPYSSTYNFEQFSVEEAQKAIFDALNSPASMRSMSKHFLHDWNNLTRQVSQSLRAQVVAHNKTLKKGQSIVTTTILDADGNSTGKVLEEGVALSRRDNPDTTACANCGSPKNLKACHSCLQRYFCSRSCLRAAWAQWHKKECTGAKAT